MSASACGRRDRDGHGIRTRAGEVRRELALGRAFVLATTLASGPLLSACTVVKVTAPDGGVQIHRIHGITKIVLDDSHGPVVVSERGIGLTTSSTLGWTLGFAQHDFALPGDGCAAVFWVTAPGETAALQALADDLPNVCMLSPHGR